MALVLALRTEPASAQSPVPIAPYRVEQFSSNNGLPQNTVSAIAQTPDGYIWIGTYDGLVRYDGLRFTTFDRGTLPAMQRTQVLNLSTDGNGVLWAGTDRGVLRYAGGVFAWRAPVAGDAGRQHPGDARLQPGYAPPRAAKWSVRDGRLMRAAFAGTAAASWALPDSNLRVAGEDGTGIVWLAGNWRLVQFANGAFRDLPPNSIPGMRTARAAFVDRDGTVWLGTNESGLFRVTPRVITTYSTEDGLAARNVYPVAEDARGRIWMGTGRGVTRWDGRAFTKFQLTTDSSSAGALRVQFTRLTADSTARNANVVRTMLALPDGRVLMALANAIVTIDGERIVHVRPLENRTPDAMLADRTGALWVATVRGLLRLHGDTATEYGEREGYPSSQAFVMYRDTRGLLWIGTARGLVRYDGARFDVFTEQQGLGSNLVRSLYEDTSGALWIGTFDGGLTRLKAGRFHAITTRDGLFANGVFQIVEDASGDFWMSSNRGIFRASRAQLDAVADGRAATVLSSAYGVPEGMRQAEANGGRPPAGVRARDGRIWFPTNDGVVVVNPAAVRRSAWPPVVTIGAMTVDGAARLPARDAVRLAPGEISLSMEYSAPTSVNAANVHVRWRLRRGDDGSPWTDGGTARTVNFARLAPGEYVFEAVASNGEGRWGAHPTALTVIVLPHIWQTTWFLALSVVLIVVGSGAGYRARVAALTAQERRLTALVAERTSELRDANEKLAQLATEDGLTGLANKRRFDEFLAAEWHRSARMGAPLSLLAIDVDHFKQFNDTYGHPAGDECLRRVAAVLRAGVRTDTDFAARQGGEEFAVVLTGTGEEGARQVAESLRAGVEALRMSHAASSTGSVVTISVGVASVTAGTATSATDGLIAFVSAADAALYAAKGGGRNRVG